MCTYVCEWCQTISPSIVTFLRSLSKKFMIVWGTLANWSLIQGISINKLVINKVSRSQGAVRSIVAQAFIISTPRESHTVYICTDFVRYHRHIHTERGGEITVHWDTLRDNLDYITPIRTQSNTYDHTALCLECCCVNFIEYHYIGLSADESYFRRQILLDSAHFGENVVLGDSNCKC